MINVNKLKILLRPRGKASYISSLPKNAKILDVGCGNNSPYVTKSILPSCQYTCIDIDDYNQKKLNIADEYILVPPDGFTKKIGEFSDQFDAVISSHNLEHCNDRLGVLNAMLDSLKSNGSIFLSFPTSSSTSFPNRAGTLNYFDDPTHQGDPPDFDSIVDLLKANKFKINYSQKQYQPLILYCLGFICEPISKISKKVMRGTWEFWGFESIIIATKNGNGQ